MLSFAPAVVNAANNGRVSDPLRFFAQRFAELADKHVHFAASASFSLDPITATREFLELSRSYDASRGVNPSHTAMRSAVHRTRNIVARDGNLKDWYPTERTAALGALSDCLDDAAAAAAGVSRNAWLRQTTAVAGRGPVRILFNGLIDPTHGYRARLIVRVLAQAQSAITSPGTWRAFDNNVRLLATVFLSEGPDGLTAAKAVSKAIRQASNSADAANRLRSVFSASPEAHVVGFWLPEVRRPSHHPAFDCRRVREADPRWDPSASSTADQDLADFVSEATPSVVLATEVDALDREHAYILAMQRAERLVDQYTAEHRAYEFAVHPEMVVLRRGDSQAQRVQPRRRTQPKPRTLLRGPDQRLEQSLRYAALARGERVAAVKVLHSWIALESLVRSPGMTVTPYPFLRLHLPRLLALHAVRHALSTTWHIARKSGQKSSRASRWRTVEAWLGVVGPENRLSDLNKWVDLIRAVPDVAPSPAPPSLPQAAPVAEAGASLRYVMDAMSPFAVQSLFQWRFLLELGPRLSAWCVEMEARAKTTVERMYVARNSAVHSGLIETAGYRQLAHAAENVVDCVFEVLPQWLATGRKPAEAIEQIGRRSRRVTLTWNQLARSPLINAQDLTRPGGDGMTR